MKKKGNKKTPILRQEVIDNPIPTSLFINPQHACAVRVTLVVLGVCLPVDCYSYATGYDVAYE